MSYETVRRRFWGLGGLESLNEEQPGHAEADDKGQDLRAWAFSCESGGLSKALQSVCNQCSDQSMEPEFIRLPASHICSRRKLGVCVSRSAAENGVWLLGCITQVLGFNTG